MYSSEYTDAAARDLTETLEYISYRLNAPIAAKNLFYEIDKKIKEIVYNPYYGRRDWIHILKEELE